MPRFALVDEHTYYDEADDVGPDGEPIKNEKGEPQRKIVAIDLDPEELDRISNTCNGRIKNTGDYCPAVVGHTKDNLPTKFQPRLVGLLKDFSVETFRNPDTGEPVVDQKSGKPKLAIYATPFAKHENLDDFLSNPRRSIELRFHEGTIDPLSLLGAEQPARDLGLHKFSAIDAPNREKPYRYSISDQKQATEQTMADDKKNDAAGDSTSGDAKMVNLVFEDARWKKMESILDKLNQLFEHDGSAPSADAPNLSAPPVDPASGPDAQPVAGEHDDLLGPAGGEPMNGDEHGGPDSFNDEPFDLTMDDADGDKDDDEEDDKKKKEDPKKMSASAPGVGNVSMPQFDKGKTKMSANDAGLEEPIKLAKDRQDKARFAKAEQRIVALENALKISNEEKELNAIQADLVSLNSEGVDYDAAYELPRLVRMSKDERTAHYNYMRTKYGKTVPGGGKLPVPTEEQAPQRFSKADQVVPVNSTGDATGAETIEIGREMAKHKISKEDAIAKLRGTSATGANGTVKVR